MPNAPRPLDLQARETVFLVREAASTRKLPLPDVWQMEMVSTPEALLTAALRVATAKRFLLIVDEEDFSSSLELLKGRLTTEQLSRFGAIVIARDAGAFLKEHGGIADLLDVVPEKEMKKLLDIACLRAVRYLMQMENGGDRGAATARWKSSMKSSSRFPPSEIPSGFSRPSS